MALGLRIEAMGRCGLADLQVHEVAGLEGHAVVHGHAPGRLAARHGAVDLRLVARRLREDHAQRQAFRGQLQVLGPQPQQHVLSIGQQRRAPGRGQVPGLPVGQREPGAAVCAMHLPLREVHGGRADEARHEAVDRAVVELERRTDLLHPARAHHDDAVGHGHGFHLVVRDVDHGVAQALVQGLDLGAHLHAQLRIQVGQRLVEEEQRGLAHHGAAHGDALALSARERARQAVQVGREVEQAGGLFDARAEVAFGLAARARAEGDVLVDRQVRVERIALEHHRDVALLRRQVVGPCAADAQLAAADGLQPRDHAQQRRLAAARGADEHDELAVGNVQVDAVHDGHAGEILAQLLELNLSHGVSLSLWK
ncbi:hypothetical protein D3C85_223000 [compost metagenome]